MNDEPYLTTIFGQVYYCNGSGREEMLFRGYVKNKSELKKIMEQLNITSL